jgi:hypothetical protein
VVVLKLQSGCNFATMKRDPVMPKTRIAVSSNTAVIRNSTFMKTRVNRKRVFTDDIYHVAAVDLADKLIERMRHGLDPILLGSVHDTYSVDPILGVRLRRKLD